MAPKRVTQEAFDDMVREFVDALGLDPDEAVKAAIEELQIEGADMSAVVKCVPGSTTLDNHPIVISTRGLRDGEADRRTHLQSLEKALRQTTETPETDNVHAIALREGTLEVLLGFVDGSVLLNELKQMCQIIALLLSGCPNMRSSFLQLKGQDKLMSFVRQLLGNVAADTHQKVAAVMRVIVAACKKCEPAKCKFMDPDFVDDVHDYLKGLLETDSTHEESVSGVLSLCTTLTNPDDPETSASQTFMHARLLAQRKIHLTILKFLEAEVKNFPEREVDMEILKSALNAIRCLAANDDICKEIADANGIAACMKILSARSDNASLIKTTLNALRQLSCSDHVKSEIIANNGASIVANLLTVYESIGDIFEGLVGLMTLITLRQPQFAQALCKEKCHEHLKEAFSTFESNPKVLRQCCACIRNFAVRDDDIKHAIISLGVESCIRDCKSRFPQECQADASSALRDLGFDDYH